MNTLQNYPLENLSDFRVHMAGQDGGASIHLTPFFQ
jgi:hypothetical protein